VSAGARGLKELDEVLTEVASLLKNNDVVGALTARGVNASLALTVAYGLEAYLHGDKLVAIEELGTALEEISRRASIPE
jgi:hypothetical protein